MIVDIELKDEASYNSDGQRMSDLRAVNFIYGANGAGKTTISRVIANPDKYQDCNITWQAGNPMLTLVYNREYVDANFNPDNELQGIFTLGIEDDSAVKAIREAKDQLTGFQVRVDDNKGTLAIKEDELAVLTNEFEDKVWTYKRKYENEFKDALWGALKSKTKFKDKLLQTAANNTADILSLEDLRHKASTIFSEDLETIPAIALPLYNELLQLEKSAILEKRVIGKDEVDIAAMIKKLGNSDWVKDGQSYFEANDSHCPFCQQKTDKEFALSLNEYFDEAYVQNLEEIDRLATNYASYSESLGEYLKDILLAPPRYLDGEQFKTKIDLLAAKLTANKRHIESKKKEPSAKVTLEPLGEVLGEIESTIAHVCEKIEAHNNTVENIIREKKTLKAQVWHYLANEAKTEIREYDRVASGLGKAIESLATSIDGFENNKTEKIKELHRLESKITSIQPTVDAINKLLTSFGFSGFSLEKAEKDGFYKIVRPDGSDVEDSLSEGEKTFVAFLYFYHFIKGSVTQSGITMDRVVVFDDPVSSLDSDILFIVSSLIKGVLKEAEGKNEPVKQVFLLTHNVYFHKEVTFHKKRSNVARNCESFWIVKKNEDGSYVSRHADNPIKTSYQLLWEEVKNPNRSGLTIQNTLRRILENYFQILGGVPLDKILDWFDGEEKIICYSLLSWVNDGSHFSNDDLYISSSPDVVEHQLAIFKKVFEKSEHIAHYNMMMGISVDDIDIGKSDT